jgi:hypothetical protein
LLGAPRFDGFRIDDPRNRVRSAVLGTHQRGVFSVTVNPKMPELMNERTCPEISVDEPAPQQVRAYDYALRSIVLRASTPLVFSDKLNFGAPMASNDLGFAVLRDQLRTPAGAVSYGAPRFDGAGGCNVDAVWQGRIDADRVWRGCSASEREREWKVPFGEFHTPIVISRADLVKYEKDGSRG